jgi:hypothetical protein
MNTTTSPAIIALRRMVDDLRSAVPFRVTVRECDCEEIIERVLPELEANWRDAQRMKAALEVLEAAKDVAVYDRSRWQIGIRP